MTVARVLEQQFWEQLPQPWYIQPQSTALPFGAAMLTPNSLILPSMTSCKLWLDACVLNQQTTFPSWQAS